MIYLQLFLLHLQIFLFHYVWKGLSYFTDSCVLFEISVRPRRTFSLTTGLLWIVFFVELFIYLFCINKRLHNTYGKGRYWHITLYRDMTYSSSRFITQGSHACHNYGFMTPNAKVLCYLWQIFHCTLNTVRESEIIFYDKYFYCPPNFVIFRITLTLTLTVFGGLKCNRIFMLQLSLESKVT